jgi:hypothetical protein
MPRGAKRTMQLRPYYYGYGKDDVINAYTPGEWGLGGSSAYSSNNPTHNVVVLILIEALMTVPAIIAPVGMILTAIDLELGFFLLCLVCTVLFTGGWFYTLGSIRDEFRARKLRRARGLPKPLYQVTDDQARKWFEQRPGILEITRENFPNSRYPFPGEYTTTN